MATLVVQSSWCSVGVAEALLSGAGIPYETIESKGSTACASRFALKGVPQQITKQQSLRLDVQKGAISGAFIDGVTIVT